MDASVDRQRDRTRSAICVAFETLVFTCRYEDIRLSEVARAANVGRSTLYMHFRNRDDVLVAAMAPLLDVLVETIGGEERREATTTVLDHFWAHRDRARMVLYGTPGLRLEQALSQACLARLQNGNTPSHIPPALVAAQISAALFSALRLWLRGDVSMSSADLAVHLCACASALRAAARTESV